MSSSQQTYDSTEDSYTAQTISNALHTDVLVGPNEPMINHVMNRNAKKLLENDLALYELYKKIFSGIGIKDYAPSATYNNGDFVWFVENYRLYLLKCVVNNNTKRPDIKLNNNEPIESYLKNSGWENKNKYLTIFDFGIAQFIQSLVDVQFDAHQSSKEYHPFGEVSLDPLDDAYIGTRLLKNDMSNIDPSRKKVFFPQTMQKLDSGVAVLNGYMRNYGQILEYDIIVKLASNDLMQENQIFSQSSALSANSLKLSMYTGLTKSSVSFQENSKYFRNSATLDIFSPELDDSQRYVAKIGMMKQANRNDYVNVYSAKITFPKPFSNRNYMVFTNSILCQTNGTVANGHKLVVPSSNEIAVCNKTRDSITMLNITFPKQSTFGDEGYNAQNGGIVSNSFHCKVIGTIGA